MKKSLAKQLLENLNAIEKKDLKENTNLNYAPHDKVMRIAEEMLIKYKDAFERLKDK